MELHAMDVQREMTHGHDFAVCRGRDRSPVGPRRSSRPASGSARPRVLRKPGEDASAVVAHGARLSVHEFAAPPRRCRRTPRRSLGARGRPRASACCVRGAARSPASRRRRRDVQGPARSRDARARARSAVSPSIASFRRTTDLGAELAEEMREVVGERVVVVDQQDQRCSASARSIAASTAASLRRHSSCSAAGSESATIPAPACRCATPSRGRSSGSRCTCRACPPLGSA